MTKAYGYLPKNQRILWIALRIVILGWGVYGLFHGSVVEFLEAIFAIIFTHLWDFFQIFGKKSFIIEVEASTQTMLSLFIFIAVCIGSTLNNRTTFEHFDIVTHCASGVLSAWFGYDFANIIYRKRGDLGPAMSSLFSLAFALSIAVGWEIYEFSMDKLYGMTLQKGNTDTMVDFISCAVGAVITMLFVSFLRNGIIGKNKEKVKEEQNTAVPTLCYDLPVGVVVACILAFAVALYKTYGCFSLIPNFLIMDVYGDTFLQKLPTMLICLAFGAYWILICVIFMCKALKIFDYKFKCEKTLTIVAFVAGFVMLFAQGLDFSPINYGMFMFSFALLLGTFHGYKVPHKIFFGLAILFTFIFGISGIISVVDYYDNTSTDKIQIYAFVSRLVSALIFYIFYGLLEKFSSEYEGIEE